MALRPEDRVEHPETYRVPTEEDVPNSAKPLPTDRNNVLLICGIVALLMVAAVTVMWVMDVEMIGFLLAIGAVLLGILAIVMARGDARVSMTLPVVSTICAGLLALFIGLDMGEVDDALEGAQPASAVIEGNEPDDSVDANPRDIGTSDAPSPNGT